MNSQEARNILLLYRPGGRDDDDPDVRAAMEQAARDPSLGEWFARQCAVQSAIQQSFRQITPPANLRTAIRPPHRIITAIQWRPVAWAAAAAVVALTTLVVWWTRPRTPDRLDDFRERMVRTALREYHMDIVTNDLTRVIEYIENKGGPADFLVPRPLAALALSGGGALRWRNQPVAMTCFDRGDRKMLFLFVVARNAVPDPPRETPEFLQISKLRTAAWSLGNRIYVLAGPDDRPLPGPIP